MGSNIPSSDRNKTIDSLRGLAMIGMVMIHTNAYHLSNHVASLLWNYLQFVVQIFVFCSMYLFVKKNDFSKYSWNDLLIYYRNYIPKRFLRLVIPYYIFLPFYLLLQYMIKHQLPSPMYVLQSLTLTGGIDINWLVLLFVQLTLLAPLLLFLFQKTKRGEIIIAVSIIVFTFLSSIPEIRAVLPNYRFVMWVGWSYFFLMGYRSVYPLIVSARKKTYILITLGLLTALFAITSEFSHLYDNKYPPTLSFTLYGAVWILVLSKLLPKLRIPKFLEAFIHFFSIYSYPLFFVHYWILVYVSVYFKLNWYLFFLIVLFSSAGIQFLGNTSIQIWRNSLFPGKGKHV